MSLNRVKKTGAYLEHLSSWRNNNNNNSNNNNNNNVNSVQAGSANQIFTFHLTNQDALAFITLILPASSSIVHKAVFF